MLDIFLSYSREDQATAKRFAEGFEREGLSVWWDARVNAGEAFDEAIEKALNEAKAVVVLWSKTSVVSRWVRAEATQASSDGRLVPAMIEPCKRPIIFELTQTADLSHWRGERSDKVWLSYVAAVRLIVERGEPTRPVSQIPVSSHPRQGLGARWIVILTVAVIVAGGALWAIARRSGEPSTTAGATSAAVPAEPRTSIAVMPFANLTGDASKDYLGEGMAEEVINTLTQVPGLKVPARTSSFAYQGRNTDIRQICRDLGVGTILEGSVRTAGKRIRITAQLINGQDGLHIWSKTYDESFSDLFKLQDDLATEIVQALQVKLNSASTASIAVAPQTQDVEAYNLYLQANAVGGGGTEHALDLALNLYGQALARDPGFARAYAARSDLRLGFLFVGFSLTHGLEDAEQDAERALALDPKLGDAHNSMALINVFRANWLKAETSFRAALAADPNNPGFHGYHALTLSATGRLHQALLEAKEVYHLAPADPGSAYSIAVISNLLGLDPDSKKYTDLGAALSARPDDLTTFVVYSGVAMRAGHFAEVADRAVATLAGPIRSAGGADVIRLVFAALGEPTKKPAARQALQRLIDRIGSSNIDVNSRKGLILDFALLDVLDPAYELANLNLEESQRTGSGGGVGWAFLWDRDMRSFRQDPRFQGFVTRLNLIDYWKQYGPPDDCDLKDGKLTCR